MGSRCVLVALGAVVLTSRGSLRAERRGGWDDDLTFRYTYEADAGEDSWVAAKDAIGCLDGEWLRSNQSDEWDGSTPAEGDGAPGGAMVQTVPGEAEGGGDASVLLIEDALTAGSAANDGRKIFLYRNAAGELDLANGVTMLARWRLTPDPVSAALGDAPNGTTLHAEGKGQVGFAQKTAAGGLSGAVCLGLAIADSGQLQIAIPGGGPVACPAEGAPGYCVDVAAASWVTAWLAAKAGDGKLELRLYLDGSRTASVNASISTGIPNGVETTAAESYIYTALGATNQDGSIQVDYICVADGFLTPGDSGGPACPSSLTAVPDGRDVVLAWTNGSKVPTGVTIVRDGATIATDVPADPPSYRDAGVPAGAHSWDLQFAVADETCDALTATADTCPAALAAIAAPDGVRLTWTVPAGVVHAGYELMRDGVEIATPSGDATTFTDFCAPTGALAYALEPSDGTCAPLETTIDWVRPDLGDGDFGSEDVGWAYVLDPPAGAGPEEYLRYEPTAGAAGCLDGRWSCGNGSDSWDGSSPGEIGDPAVDVAGQAVEGAEAPGGIGLITVGDVGAYLFEDAGDPRNAVPPSPVGWQDPCNRKLYLCYDARDAIPDCDARSLISDGVTLRVRLRLTPAGQGVDVAATPNGIPTQNDGKGMVVLAHDAGRTSHGVDQRIGLALDVHPAAPGTGCLHIGQRGSNGATALAIPVPDPTEWLDVWLTAEDPDPSDRLISLRLYLNGSTAPTVAMDDFLPNDDGAEDHLCGNQLAIGLNVTPDDGSMQLDLVGLADGVVAPSGGSHVRGFHRGDANIDGNIDITDAIFVLGYLFLGSETPRCRDAADTNDDGRLDLADAIFLLGFLFTGGPEPPSPGPASTPCGPDPTAEPEPALDCREYPGC